jgi:hypothetical protein
MAFQFRLELKTEHPPTRERSRQRCRTGGRATRSRSEDGRSGVLGVRDDDADQPPVLVVEDMPGAATSNGA